MENSKSEMTDNHNLGICLAVTAGTMASLGSTCAKLAMTASAVEGLCSDVSSSLFSSDDNARVICSSISSVLRIICFGCTFLFNALMWTFYTKSLQYCTSTVEAIITNTGANFLVTAVIGLLMFGETLSILWWLGSCLILAGLVLIHKGSLETKTALEQKVK